MLASEHYFAAANRGGGAFSHEPRFSETCFGPIAIIDYDGLV